MMFSVYGVVYVCIVVFCVFLMLLLKYFMNLFFKFLYFCVILNSIVFAYVVDVNCVRGFVSVSGLIFM